MTENCRCLSVENLEQTGATEDVAGSSLAITLSIIIQSMGLKAESTKNGGQRGASLLEEALLGGILAFLPG